MNIFGNRKISTKLTCGFATMVVFMVIIGVTGFQSARTIQGALVEIFTDNMPSMDYLIEADRDLQQLLVARPGADLHRTCLRCLQETAEGLRTEPQAVRRPVE